MSAEERTNPEPEAKPLVCLCHGVSEAAIQQAILQGAKTLEEIREKTKASTGCGGCALEVEKILEIMRKQQLP